MVKAKVESTSTVAGCLGATSPIPQDDLPQRLAEAVAQQAAANEILQMIANAPADVQPVLDAIAKSAGQLCQAPFARILIVDGDVLDPRAFYAADGSHVALPNRVPLSRSSITGRAIQDCVTIHHADVVPLLVDEYPEARLNALIPGLSGRAGRPHGVSSEGVRRHLPVPARTGTFHARAGIARADLCRPGGDRH
jgi:hypothetical protein